MSFVIGSNSSQFLNNIPRSQIYAIMSHIFLNLNLLEIRVDKTLSLVGLNIWLRIIFALHITIFDHKHTVTCDWCVLTIEMISIMILIKIRTTILIKAMILVVIMMRSNSVL